MSICTWLEGAVAAGATAGRKARRGKHGNFFWASFYSLHNFNSASCYSTLGHPNPALPRSLLSWIRFFSSPGSLFSFLSTLLWSLLAVPPSYFYPGTAVSFDMRLWPTGDLPFLLYFHLPLCVDMREAKTALIFTRKATRNSKLVISSFNWEKSASGSRLCQLPSIFRSLVATRFLHVFERGKKGSVVNFLQSLVDRMHRNSDHGINKKVAKKSIFAYRTR